MKTKPAILFMVLILLGTAAYLDSPYSILNRDYSFTADQPAAAQPISKMISSGEPETEERLVKKEKTGGYIIETYQEYEIYKDKDGNITKKVPTSQYDELKYWDYKKK
jgi:hypothetical protein